MRTFRHNLTHSRRLEPERCDTCHDAEPTQVVMKRLPWDEPAELHLCDDCEAELQRQIRARGGLIYE